MYNLLSRPLWGIIGLCHFLLTVLWHYHWYCGEHIRKINPELWERSKKESFIAVVKYAWHCRHHNEGD